MLIRTLKDHPLREVRMLSQRQVIAALLAVVVLCAVAAWLILPGPAETPSVAVEDIPEPERSAEPIAASPAAPELDEHPEQAARDAEPETEPGTAQSEEGDAMARRRATLERLQKQLLELEGLEYRGAPRIAKREDGSLDIDLSKLPIPDPKLLPSRLGSDPVAITLSGRVTDEAGRAVENARIHVWPSALTTNSDGKTKRDVLNILKPAKDVMPPHDVERPGTSDYHLSAAGTVVAVTDASGFFHAEVEAARYVDSRAIEALHLRIRPTKPGFAWRSNAEFSDVKPGARLEDIQLVLGRAAIIAGRVVDEKGKPVTNALVGLSRPNNAEPDDGPLPGRAIYHQMRVNADGTFRFDAMQPGTWRASAFCNSHQSIDGRQSVTVTAGSDVQLPDFVMRAASSLRARVLGIDGKPLAKTRITFHVREATGSETTRQLTTKDDGEVTYTLIPVATMEVSISAPGYLRSAPYPLHPRGGDSLDLGDVPLIPAPPGSED